MTSPEACEYVVKFGEDSRSISLKFGMSFEEFRQLNPSKYNLKVGMVVRVINHRKDDGGRPKYDPAFSLANEIPEDQFSLKSTLSDIKNMPASAPPTSFYPPSFERKEITNELQESGSRSSRGSKKYRVVTEITKTKDNLGTNLLKSFDTTANTFVKDPESKSFYCFLCTPGRLIYGNLILNLSNIRFKASESFQREQAISADEFTTDYSLVRKVMLSSLPVHKVLIATLFALLSAMGETTKPVTKEYISENNLSSVPVYNFDKSKEPIKVLLYEGRKRKTNDISIIPKLKQFFYGEDDEYKKETMLMKNGKYEDHTIPLFKLIQRQMNTGQYNETSKSMEHHHNKPYLTILLKNGKYITFFVPFNQGKDIRDTFVMRTLIRKEETFIDKFVSRKKKMLKNKDKIINGGASIGNLSEKCNTQTTNDKDSSTHYLLFNLSPYMSTETLFGRISHKLPLDMYNITNIDREVKEDNTVCDSEHDTFREFNEQIQGDGKHCSDPSGVYLVTDGLDSVSGSESDSFDSFTDQEADVDDNYTNEGRQQLAKLYTADILRNPWNKRCCPSKNGLVPPEPIVISKQNKKGSVNDGGIQEAQENIDEQENDGDMNVFLKRKCLSSCYSIEHMKKMLSISQMKPNYLKYYKHNGLINSVSIKGNNKYSLLPGVPCSHGKRISECKVCSKRLNIDKKAQNNDDMCFCRPHIKRFVISSANIVVIPPYTYRHHRKMIRSGNFNISNSIKERRNQRGTRSLFMSITVKDKKKNEMKFKLLKKLFEKGNSNDLKNKSKQKYHEEPLDNGNFSISNLGFPFYSQKELKKVQNTSITQKYIPFGAGVLPQNNGILLIFKENNVSEDNFRYSCDELTAALEVLKLSNLNDVQLSKLKDKGNSEGEIGGNMLNFDNPNSGSSSLGIYTGGRTVKIETMYSRSAPKTEGTGTWTSESSLSTRDTKTMSATLTGGSSQVSAQLCQQCVNTVREENYRVFVGISTILQEVEHLATKLRSVRGNEKQSIREKTKEVARHFCDNTKNMFKRITKPLKHYDENNQSGKKDKKEGHSGTDKVKEYHDNISSTSQDEISHPLSPEDRGDKSSSNHSEFDDISLIDKQNTSTASVLSWAGDSISEESIVEAPEDKNFVPPLKKLFKKMPSSFSFAYSYSKIIFDTKKHGMSLNALYEATDGNSSILIIAEPCGTTDKTIGCFVDSPIKVDSPTHIGGCGCFIFSMNCSLADIIDNSNVNCELSTYHWNPDAPPSFALCRRKGLEVGAGPAFSVLPGMRLQSRNSRTFASDSLLGTNETVDAKRLVVYGIGEL